MSRRKILFVAGLVLGLGLWKISHLWTLPWTQIWSEQGSSFKSSNAQEDLSSRSPNQVPGAAVATNLKASLAHSHLEEMTQTLSQFSKREAQLRDLVEYLKTQRQEPVVTRDQNAETGEMVIVRTQRPPDGTRYFHAQYFSDEEGKGFVQHMSFEFQPGPTSMIDATEAVQKSFPSLGNPQTRKDDFVRWNLDDNYILWIKKMTAEDLQDDPFNAYTPADVGTVRVAVELEIHNHDDDHH
jgi:hypothetical protein